MSTPMRKTVKPKIISTAPMRNLISNAVSIGEIVKCKINTITVIGRTEYRTSLSFERITFKYSTSSLPVYDKIN